MKTSLIAYTLGERVNKELQKYPADDRWAGWEIDTPQGLDEVTNALSKCVVDFISPTIEDLSKNECVDCKNGFMFNMEIHDCVNSNRQQNFSAHFEKALYKINWNALASDFVKNNVNKPYLRWFEDILFSELETEKFFTKVEEMYVNKNILDVPCHALNCNKTIFSYLIFDVCFLSYHPNCV